MWDARRYKGRMGSQSVEYLKAAVLILGLTTLGASLAIFFLMEIHFRSQRAREVRRLVIASRLSPSPDEPSPEISWSLSSRADREIILDVLVDQSSSGDVKRRNAVRKTVMGLGLHDQWIRDLGHGSVAAKVRAARRLGALQPASSESIQALVQASLDPSRRVRLAVTLALGRLRDPDGIPGLIRVAHHPVRAVPDLTLAAALAACAEGEPTLLSGLMRRPEPRLRIMATWALSEIADRTVLGPLLDLAGDTDPEVRGKSARALARIQCPETVAVLMRLARDPIWFVRVRALDALGELRDPEGEPAALRGLEDPALAVRLRAAFALRRIRGMKGEVAARVLSMTSRRGFNSLISEWDRAGFLSQVAAGLSPCDWPRFRESVATVRILLDAGVTRALGHFLLAHPHIKVRLRLARLFAESTSPRAKEDLASVTRNPKCHPLLAAEIAKKTSAKPAAPRSNRPEKGVA